MTSIRNRLERIFVGLNSAVYRSTNGKLGGAMGKAPILLLDTVGRKTGQRRTSPVLYLEDNGRYIVVASHGGAPTDPAWALNLRAEPETTIRIGARTIPVTAVELAGEDRDRVWPELNRMYAGYTSYRTKTSRAFPVFALSPRD